MAYEKEKGGDGLGYQTEHHVSGNNAELTLQTVATANQYLTTTIQHPGFLRRHWKSSAAMQASLFTVVAPLQVFAQVTLFLALAKQHEEELSCADGRASDDPPSATASDSKPPSSQSHMALSVHMLRISDLELDCPICRSFELWTRNIKSEKNS
ncbi:uncharacterized protein BCR38DRAFT_411965 [Pseudomassariella vexata]|uniref:Uncharacterized protein n=1 Tax=Pseudomassariella vexata TaxID=1141098 RepID=A0A1Y2DNY9_9PEZI|nr:uncharacterized protein BCR38DRAFT_411965 [Pseudomassariella vexata]ORY60856.1 hypothetical protein BCR38DRAFT_411965 [Pseudomassariella vexata]